MIDDFRYGKPSTGMKYHLIVGERDSSFSAWWITACGRELLRGPSTTRLREVDHRALCHVCSCTPSAAKLRSVSTLGSAPRSQDGGS